MPSAHIAAAVSKLSESGRANPRIWRNGVIRMATASVAGTAIDMRPSHGLPELRHYVEHDRGRRLQLASR
jgi:hypothetical protein